MLSNLVAYLASVVIVTAVAIYGLRLPTLITGNKSLVQEYYYDNAVSSFVLDIFLIGAYLWVSLAVSRRLDPKASVLVRSLEIALVSFIITSIFMIVIPMATSASSFFNRWFKAVGYKAAVYDAILITLTYLTMNRVKDILRK